MQTSTGGCHCGKVRFEAKGDFNQVIECNCSNCEKRGLLLSFIPADDFKLLTPAESLQDYRFNKKAIAHMVCKDCGVEPFGIGEDGGSKMIAVNVRCFDDVDLAAFERMPYDGKAT